MTMSSPLALQSDPEAPSLSNVSCPRIPVANDYFEQIVGIVDGLGSDESQCVSVGRERRQVVPELTLGRACHSG